MPKSKPSQDQEDEKPQPRIEVTKVSRKEAEKKSVPNAPPPSATPEEEDSSQATVIMQAPTAFEQLVDKILKKHKI